MRLLQPLVWSPKNAGRVRVINLMIDSSGPGEQKHDLDVDFPSAVRASTSRGEFLRSAIYVQMQIYADGRFVRNADLHA